MDWQSIQPIFLWLSDHPFWSGFFVFVIALTESLIVVGLIVPGTVLMFGVGTLVGAGVLDVKIVLLLAFIGAVLGDGISFWIGAKYRTQLEHCWPFNKKPQILEIGKKYFEKHGSKSVFFGRFVGPVRPIIPAVAGMMHMPARKFLFINIISAAGWAPVYLIPGILFGSSIELASQIGFRFVVILLGLIVVAALFVILIKKMSSRVVRNFSISITVITFVIGIWVFSTFNQSTNNTKVLIDDWLNASWQIMPQKRIDIFGRQQQTFNLQWLGDINEINKYLTENGWKLSGELGLKNTLHRLATDVDASQVARLPQLHLHHAESVLFSKYSEENNVQLVLQLWATNLFFDDQQQYWLGFISEQKLISDKGWISHFEIENMTTQEIVEQLINENNWTVKIQSRSDKTAIVLIYK